MQAKLSSTQSVNLADTANKAALQDARVDFVAITHIKHLFGAKSQPSPVLSVYDTLQYYKPKFAPEGTFVLSENFYK